MPVHFIKQGRTYTSEHCLKGLNLLGHAQLIELEVGSECGGHGRCGKDRLVIPLTEQIKVNPPTEIERAHLSAEQLGAGIRLGCQCFPNENAIELTVNLLLK